MLLIIKLSYPCKKLFAMCGRHRRVSFERHMKNESSAVVQTFLARSPLFLSFYFQCSIPYNEFFYIFSDVALSSERALSSWFAEPFVASSLF